jgi:hypothetical protein
VAIGAEDNHPRRRVSVLDTEISLRVTARAGASPEALKAIATIAVDGLKSQ